MVLVVFGGPNYYGLRPHAVKAGLEPHDLRDLTSLGTSGPITSILTYDAWCKDRDGQTGWFLFPAAKAQGITLNVDGMLDPQIASFFGAPPRRCNETSLPEKMIRAIEPDRRQSGFLGRSTCARSKMDIGDIIAASRPAVQKKLHMTHAELTRFDATPMPYRQRDSVKNWPTPYAHYRRIILPTVWATTDPQAGQDVNGLLKKLKAITEQLTRENHILLRMEAQAWLPFPIDTVTPDHMHVNADGKIALIHGIEFRSIYVHVLCAPDARAACDAVDISDVIPAVHGLRDPQVLAQALATQRALPDTQMARRDVMRLQGLSNDSISALKAAKRTFLVTWCEEVTPPTPK